MRGHVARELLENRQYEGWYDNDDAFNENKSTHQIIVNIYTTLLSTGVHCKSYPLLPMWFFLLLKSSLKSVNKEDTNPSLLPGAFVPTPLFLYRKTIGDPQSFLKL